MFYFEVMRALHESDIRYLIVGGLAVNLYGVPRVTQDIDIILLMEKDNILNLCACMKDLGYEPLAPVDPYGLANPAIRDSWIKEKNMKAFSFRNRDAGYKTVDVLIVHPLDFESAYGRRTVRDVRGIPLSIVSRKDLITLKKAAARPQDISDIKLLAQAAAMERNPHEKE